MSRRTHDERSNSMNSSAFCWPVSSSVLQPVGKGELVLSPFVWDEGTTCRSLYTTRPQTSFAPAPTGVLKLMYSCAVRPPAAGFWTVIQEMRFSFGGAFSSTL